ncbi:tumor necrosis factor receptor superfamily member 5 isoform X1 [Engystomops pustulosus]|uniref:tumor necrosis factor receptor superfamily member 5 isoform X1 n=1 Tax=Engystomops pustulosus TaxID=76066 RepID=UPI003AFB7E83
MHLWMIALIVCSCYFQTSMPCDNHEYQKDGRCCSLCRPGHWLAKDCNELNGTECTPCAHGEYQDTYNRETSCRLHRECNERLGFETITEGTATANLDCRCQSGKHCSSEVCETCVLNKVCGPGEGVIRRATNKSDTECSPCYEGTFSNAESTTEPCKNWSKCGDGEMIIQPGTPTSDVICELSSSPEPSNTWVYIVVIMLVLVVIVAPTIIIIRKSYRKDKYKNRQNPPEGNNLQLIKLVKPIENNLPEEDLDDQDITMQGLPVAQEQGKDYHMSQEEV